MLDPVVLSESITGPVPAALPGFRCTLRNSNPDVAWIHLAGELDIGTTPRLQDALREAGLQARRIVLDLRELTFMDSSGIHAIVDASRRGGPTRGRLVIVRGPSAVNRLFELTGLSDALEIVDLDPCEPAVQALAQLAPGDAT
jgi:anti-sigma B factor antagonist